MSNGRWNLHLSSRCRVDSILERLAAMIANSNGNRIAHRIVIMVGLQFGGALGATWAILACLKWKALLPPAYTWFAIVLAPAAMFLFPLIGTVLTVRTNLARYRAYRCVYVLVYAIICLAVLRWLWE